MKFQTIAFTGLFALAATVTAQSAAFSAQLTSDDVAAIGINAPRNEMMVVNNSTQPTRNENRPAQVNQTHSTPRKVSASYLTPTQLTSDDVAAIGINMPRNTGIGSSNAVTQRF